jgi:hypothetical protein
LFPCSSNPLQPHRSISSVFLLFSLSFHSGNYYMLSIGVNKKSLAFKYVFYFKI